MQCIKRIKIENIKGISSLEIQFNKLNANQPNIVVAPNGYGKSTITKAFEAAKHGKMKLGIQDKYKQNENNHPKLELELYGDITDTFIATDTESNISSNIHIEVINSPLYAKSTVRNYGNGVQPTADLRIEDIIIYSNIPDKAGIDYSYNKIKNDFGNQGKLFLNISSMLLNFDNINILLEGKVYLDKCIQQPSIQKKFERFLSKCPDKGTIKNIKSGIDPNEIDLLKNNSNINSLFECIYKMKGKPDNWEDIDTVFTAIQICKVIREHYQKEEKNIIKKTYSYLEYKAIREIIDNRLSDFNTTGRTIKTSETKNKLVVKFDRADSLSNGERDILSFVVNLAKFEYSFKKKVGILIIDEVFDYLDGSNMLAVQYYLMELINKFKEENRVLFPILFTHLDPDVFTNYYFKKKKIHYISFSGKININTDLVKMLRLRSIKNETGKEEIEKYYIHYIDDEYKLDKALADKVSEGFSDSNIVFRNKLYEEVTEKYLKNKKYDPIMVIAGLRIKIEEKVYSQLNSDMQEDYIDTHTVIKKLEYAMEKGVDVPELFFLLQPLYNDGLHLYGNDDVVNEKIKSCYLKTSNLHIRNMIQKVFN